MRTGGKPTLLKVELLDSSLVGRNGSALNTNRVLLDRLRRINCNLIICLVSVFQPQIIVLQVDVQVRMDELVLDVLPDDTGHLVAVELHHWVLDLDLLEAGHVARLYKGGSKACGCVECGGCCGEVRSW